MNILHNIQSILDSTLSYNLDPNSPPYAIRPRLSNLNSSSFSKYTIILKALEKYLHEIKLHYDPSSIEGTDINNTIFLTTLSLEALSNLRNRIKEEGDAFFLFLRFVPLESFLSRLENFKNDYRDLLQNFKDSLHNILSLPSVNTYFEDHPNYKKYIDEILHENQTGGPYESLALGNRINILYQDIHNTSITAFKECFQSLAFISVESLEEEVQSELDIFEKEIMKTPEDKRGNLLTTLQNTRTDLASLTKHLNTLKKEYNNAINRLEKSQGPVIEELVTLRDKLSRSCLHTLHSLKENIIILYKAFGGSPGRKPQILTKGIEKKYPSPPLLHLLLTLLIIIYPILMRLKKEDSTTTMVYNTTMYSITVVGIIISMILSLVRNYHDDGMGGVIRKGWIGLWCIVLMGITLPHSGIIKSGMYSLTTTAIGLSMLTIQYLSTGMSSLQATVLTIGNLLVLASYLAGYKKFFVQGLTPGCCMCTSFLVFIVILAIMSWIVGKKDQENGMVKNGILLMTLMTTTFVSWIAEQEYVSGYDDYNLWGISGYKTIQGD